MSGLWPRRALCLVDEMRVSKYRVVVIPDDSPVFELTAGFTKEMEAQKHLAE